MRISRVLLFLTALSASCRRGEEHFEPLPPAFEISFVGAALLPQLTSNESQDVGGISAVAYEAESGAWLALSDARVSCRFYEMEVGLDGSALSVVVRRTVALQNAEGLDAEGMIRAPWGGLLIATEGDRDASPVREPALLELDREGALVRRFEVPAKFLFSGSPQTGGVRDNLGFESLTISPDAKRVLVAAEGTLVQDGPVAGVDSVGFSRILVYAVEGNALSAVGEYMYPVGPFAAAADFTEQEVSGGLVDLVALGGDRLLALERIFIRELSGEKRDRNEARIFAVDLSAATDVHSFDSLRTAGDWRPVTKELVLDLDDMIGHLPREYPRLDNLEAMGLGPDLPGGGKSLLLVSDDNFESKQRTQFLLFRLKGV